MDLKELARAVVAAYSGEVEGDGGQTWMEHLQKSQDGTKGVDKAMKMLSDAEPKGPVPHIHDDSTGKALIDDIKGGLSIPREMDGPAVSTPEESTGTGEPITHIMTPNRYTEEGTQKHWWDAKERDDLNTGTAFGNEFNGAPVEASMKRLASGNYIGFRKEAKTLSQILYDNRNHKKNVMDQRGAQLHPRLASSDEERERGLYIYKTPSSSGGPERTTVIQFMKKPGDATKKLIDHDCLIGCSCPAFLYWGAQYYAVQGGYMHMDMFKPTLVAPKDYIPGVTKEIARGKNGTYCKHLFAAIHAVSREKDEGLQLEDIKIEIPEPHYKAEKIFDTMDIQDFNDFKEAVSRGSVPPALESEVTTLLQGKGGESKDFHDEFLPVWLKATSPKAVQWKVSFVKDLIQAPSIIMWLLIQEHRTNGSVPEQVLSEAWKTISFLLGIGRKAKPKGVS